MLQNVIEKVKNATSEDRPVSEASLALAARSLTDSRRPIRLGVYLLVGAVVAFFLWAAFAPLDAGVPAPGVVAVESKRKIVQHLTGGIIKTVHVTEAQFVKAGDPLITLDDTMAKANYDAVRQQYYSLQAQADRLHAEIIQAPKISFSPVLLDAGNDPQAADSMSTQQQLFTTRRQALRGELDILASSERTQQEQIVALEAQLRGKKEQLKFVEEQLAGSRELAREGYLSRKSRFDEERLAVDLNASVLELTSAVARARSMVIEAGQRRVQRQRDYQKEVETHYADIRREAAVAAERFRSAAEDYRRTVVRAPVDGFVNGLSALTVGSVVSPAVRLMDVVPKDETLIMEVKIEPHVIDRVHAGLGVAINLSVFANDPSLVLEGELVSVSPDLVADPNPNVAAHYVGRVKVTPEGIAKLGSRNLQPGMPVQVTIRTGERSMLTYLLKPLTLRLAGAMKEL